jgi:hypothetical protein
MLQQIPFIAVHIYAALAELHDFDDVCSRGP